MRSRVARTAGFLLLGLIGPATLAASDLKSLPRFYPHLTTSARTVGPWHLSYEPFPGSNGLESVLLNSVTVGLGNRFQLGMIPLFYAAREHVFNLGFKWNVWNSKTVQFGLGVSGITVRIQSMPERPKVSVNYGVLIMNWFPFGDALSFGGNFNFVDLSSELDSLDDQLNAQEVKSEWFVDIAWKLSDHFVFTPGFGRRRLDTLDPLHSPIPPGYGASLSWTRRKAHWFPRLSLGGNYCPSVGRKSVLFSFEI